MIDQSPLSKKLISIGVNIALFFIGIHLFLTNSSTIAHLEIGARPSQNVFDFSSFQIDNIIAIIKSASYSLISGIAVKLPFPTRLHYIIIGWFSLITGAAVLINYSAFPNFQKIGAVFYAIYFCSIISAIGLYLIIETKHLSKDKDETELTALRNKLYNRKKNLKYHGLDIESDKIIMELKKAISKLTSN